MTQDRFIKILDEQTINQIAAGEVVENPASCVKELVENAIDAGADHIVISSERGGQARLSVSDNGSGLSAEQLRLAIERHATSKIQSAQDLLKLQTLGFRGEALAAICSVAKVTMTTCSGASSLATSVQIENGSIVHESTTHRKRGTTVEVASLFYNTYARKAFLAAVGKDTLAISKILTSIALVNTKVGFEWICDGKQEFCIDKKASLKERIELLLGSSFFNELCPIDYQKGELRLSGFIGNAGIGRANSRGQHLFVNGRALASKFFSKAILEGYATRIADRRFPIFVLNFELNPEEIDVNVHPQKKEVRFRRQEKIALFLVDAISQNFALPIAKVVPKVPSSMQFPKLTSPKAVFAPARKCEIKKSAFEYKPLKLLAHFLLVERYDFASGNSYIVDCRRASYALAYFEMMEKENSREPLASQPLLFPITFECGLHEAKVVVNHLPLLQELGFVVRPFGDKTFIVDAIYPSFEADEVKELFKKLSSDISHQSKMHRKKMVELLCRQTGKKRYSPQQAVALTKALFEKGLHQEKIHGKALVYELTPENLNSLFK